MELSGERKATVRSLEASITAVLNLKVTIQTEYMTKLLNPRESSSFTTMMKVQGLDALMVLLLVYITLKDTEQD